MRGAGIGKKKNLKNLVCTVFFVTAKSGGANYYAGGGVAITARSQREFIDLDWNLPQPISDSEIVQQWGMLCVTIKNPVTDRR